MSTTIAPATAVAQEQTDETVRLSLLDHGPGRTTTLDGAWWPHSISLVTEVPPLFAELKRRGLHVSRVGFNRALWETAPRKVRGNGGRIGLGWFSGIDPHLVSLTGSMGERLELLVIPPETSPESAARAMVLATTPRNRTSPTQVLADSESGDENALAAQESMASLSRMRRDSQGDPYADWEAEGGARLRPASTQTPPDRLAHSWGNAN
jgi:Family of unknown function (DUF5994)